MSQMGHSISQYFIDYPELFKLWNNSYLISLSIDSKEKLQHLLFNLKKLGIPFSYFIEPDIGNEITSICFLEMEETKKITSTLPLSLKNINK